MIILDIEGLTLSIEDKEILFHPSVGGVIFFSRNFESCDQMAALTGEVKNLRDDLVLCVDQEGGRVQRFVNGLTRLPPLGSLGECIDKGQSLEEVSVLSENLGILMALEVRSLGIDISFAPVLDLNKGISEIIGNRAFYRDPAMVSRLAEAYTNGMGKAGMPATGKHFPGHGSVALDSHLGLPQDLRTFNEISDDLAPFQHLIAKQIPALMTAHIVFPNIDPNPVSFSSYWLQTVLRKQLQFQGAIISDDLSMGGAAGMGSYTQRAQRACEAGCDFILVCNHRAGAEEIIENVRMKTDPISQQRRQNLLATRTVPNFKELSYFPMWKEVSSYVRSHLIR